MRIPDWQDLTISARRRRWLEIALLLLIVAAGMLFRLDDLRDWRQEEAKTFYNGEPIHNTFDAWFYLGLAQDLLEDRYHPVDEKRGVPDSPPRPSPPPLLSVLAAFLVTATNLSLSWIGALLPVALGPLLAVPLYFLGRFYGGPLMGLSAALLAVLSPIYVMRSNIGRFDTDCLVVTLAVAPALLFLHFGTKTTARRYLYLAGGLLAYLLSLWWWDQAPDVVTATSLLPLGVALAFFYRPAKRDGLLLYGGLGAVALVLLGLAGLDLPLKLIQGLWGKFLYISKDAAGDFPNIGITITEQGRPPLGKIIREVTGLPVPRQAGVLLNILYALPMLAGLAGLVLLVRRRGRETLFLLPLFGLAALSFYANRFLLFLVPVYALGIGAFLAGLRDWLPRQGWLGRVTIPLLIVFLLLPLYTHNRQSLAWPKEPAWVVAGMEETRRRTPDDAVIWAWWDHGYALNYYARRATVTDGSIHGGERVVYSALPLATKDFRMAANFMQFFTVRGEQGMRRLQRACGDDAGAALDLIKEVMATGPLQAEAAIAAASLRDSGELQSVDDWRRFFFPERPRPLYLFLDEKMPQLAYWWYWFGTWDINKQEGHHPRTQIFYDVRYVNSRVTGSMGLRIDVATGEMRVPAMNLHTGLAALAALIDSRPHEKNYTRPGGFFFSVIERARFGLLMDEPLYESVFGKLFARQQYDPRYFRPVILNQPAFQLWEVRGETIAN